MQEELLLNHILALETKIEDMRSLEDRMNFLMVIGTRFYFQINTNLTYLGLMEMLQCGVKMEQD